MLAVGAAASRAGSPRCWPFCRGPAQGFIQYASKGANANASLFWVRFMPPPHAQPPGSNKSQRGRECCKKTVPLQFLCEGREIWGAQPAAPRCPSTTNYTRDHPQKPGETERDRVCFLAIHLPSCASVVCVPRYWRLGWSHQPHLGRQVYYTDQRFCAKVLPSV